jgi:hypothetical protein
MFWRDDMPVDVDAVVDDAIAGHKLKDIARAHSLTVSEVNKILDEETERALNNKQLRRELMLEAKRLRAIGKRYFERALSDDEQAPASAIIYVKASERLATLLGLNAPSNHTVQMHVAPPETVSSTERIRAALDRLRDEHKLKEGNGEDKPPDTH